MILWPNNKEITDAEASRHYGGKAAALRRMAQADLPIPDWFVVSPDSCTKSRKPTAALRKELAAALEKLCPNGERVAVRSSAVDEDGNGHSFAGQFESYLWVAKEDVPERVKDVWDSAFGERVVAYRKERGLPPEPVAPAVLIQRMIDAEAAGVAFSADPVSGRRGTALVSAVWGLGTALVGGDADADTYEIDRNSAITTRHIANKTFAHRPGPDGIHDEPLEEGKGDQPALTDAQAIAVAELARKAERHAKRPQDIEWAREGDRIFLLQSRPITTLATLPDPDGVLNVWDNSNIAESYNGITTPLTFSFARNAYEHVYREFCRLLSVPEGRIAADDLAFRNLLGLIRGRVYYNLGNWHRLLALLPGYGMNRKFMEQMMGVKEPLPDEAMGPPAPPLTDAEKVRDGIAFLGSVGGLIRSQRRLPESIAAFYKRLDVALAPTNDDLVQMRADELASHYHDLERLLLVKWDAPLENDFFAMIFHGLLRRLTEKWIAKGDDGESLHNNLVTGEGGIISAEPAQRVSEMAQKTAGDTEAIRVLNEQSPQDALRWLRNERPELAQSLDSYLQKFGDRCLEELKLESATLSDDPTPLLRAVGGLAERGGAVERAMARGAESPREQAEAQIQAALRGKPVRQAIFRKVLKHARDRIRNRENLRFERTRVFGRIRRIFVEIGRRFTADDLLDEPRDIFYLEVGEILGVIEGTATSSDLRGLVAVRKTEFDHFRTLPAPADRFETRGMVSHPGNEFLGKSTSGADTEHEDSDSRRGLACCPGVVRGPVRVITDPRGATLPPGSILVAERTDPGWILLFPSASGLLVERGSLLSHSAIVAREMRIPCIVSVPGVTTWLKDGDWVEMDGGSGVVKRVLPLPPRR